MTVRRTAVLLTAAEARALWQAAGEVLDHPDAVEASFPNPSTRDAAFRAHDALVPAWAPAYRRRERRERSG